MKLRGHDRAIYPDEIGVDIGQDAPANWYGDDGLDHGVVIDSVTGIAFTAHNAPGQDIPRLALAELFDDGFEP